MLGAVNECPGRCDLKTIARMQWQWSPVSLTTGLETEISDTNSAGHNKKIGLWACDWVFIVSASVVQAQMA